MVTELSKMPEIEAWTAVTSPLFSNGGGNNIVDPETGEEMFNATDLYMAGDNYLDMLDIKLRQGRGFNANSDSLKEMMVSPDFAQKLKNEKKWKDVIGRKILITEHSQTGKDLFTIVGIYDNFHANTALDDDDRPTMTVPLRPLRQLHQLFSAEVSRPYGRQYAGRATAAAEALS